jgi:glutamyl-tRNA synthetase
VAVILEGMRWLGLKEDEGPYFQTQRYPRYRAVIDEMLAKGLAYRCYCSREELDAMREAQLARKEKPRYDGRWRDSKEPPPPGVTPVIRFRNPLGGEVVVDDLVHGRTVFQNAELDDLIIQRSDGNPTYNFCVVVDDWDMGVTHVIRGDDHLNNTPRQINMLKALGATPPAYAHVPMILGADGTKLSKRHGAVSVLEYQKEGFLPDALLNYLVRLGWSHGDQEFFTREQMIAAFDIADVNKAAAAFNPDKLLWLNQQHIIRAPQATLVAALREQLAVLGVHDPDPALCAGVVEALRERAKTMKEMAASSLFFFHEPVMDEKAVAKHLTPEAKALLGELRAAMGGVAEWSAPALHTLLQEFAAARSVGLGKVAQPLRVAVTGGTVSPPIDATLAVLGRERVMARVAAAAG